MPRNGPNRLARPLSVTLVERQMHLLRDWPRKVQQEEHEKDGRRVGIHFRKPYPHTGPRHRGGVDGLDRSKDLIKSGGEWISSIDLENAAVAHPDIMEAAAIAIPHPKWSERPLLVVVPRAGVALDRAAVLAFLDGKVAKWWLPDDVLFVDALPHTATGKVSKRNLREMYAMKQLSVVGK